MKPIPNPKKIPVFHHIAKCAGTYTLSWMQMLCRRYHIMIGDNQKPGWTSLRIRRCEVSLGDGRHFTSCVYTPTDIHANNESFVPIGQDEHADTIDLKSFINTVKSGDVVPFSISINPAAPGIKSANKAIDKILNITGRSKAEFTILRDPFRKASSLFSYLTSDDSKHEPTHNAITHDKFADYLKSLQLEDSWLIRNLMNLSDGQEINKKHYDKCVNIMRNWIVGDISQTDDVIDSVFGECYGIVKSDVESHVVDVWRNNTSNKLKTTIQDVDSDTREKFLARTEWDRKLWETFCK